MRKGFLKNLIKNEGGEKTMKRLILITGLLIAVLSVPILSEAIPVTINNPGFESPILIDSVWQAGIPGWITSGGITNNAGVYNPPVSKYSSGIPEGNNVAFTNRPSISQQLSYYLSANTELTLSVDVGWRLDIGMLQYAVQLLAGGNLLAPDSESTPPLVKGGFITSILSYDVTASNPYLGQQVEIRLLRTGGGQVNFDNVRLENDPNGPTVVPEPSTLLLLGSGLAGFGYFIRRRRG